MNRRESIAAEGRRLMRLVNLRKAFRVFMMLPTVARISRLYVSQKDVIVVEFAEPLSDEQAESIRRSAEEIWPEQQCLVLEPGVKIRTATHADARELRIQQVS